jgi:hypothetical protein
MRLLPRNPAPVESELKTRIGRPALALRFMYVNSLVEPSILPEGFWRKVKGK